MSSAAFASCRESCLHRPTFDGDTPSRPAALASGATVLRWPRTLGRRTPLATADAPGTCGTLLRARTSPRTRGTCAGSHVRPAATRYGWCRHPKGPPLYLVAGGANRPPPFGLNSPADEVRRGQELLAGPAEALAGPDVPAPLTRLPTRKTATAPTTLSQR